MDDVSTPERTRHGWEVEHGVTCVVCPDCAFTFDATHEDSDGGYSCPNCADRRTPVDVAPEAELLDFQRCVECTAPFDPDGEWCEVREGAAAVCSRECWNSFVARFDVAPEGTEPEAEILPEEWVAAIPSIIDAACRLSKNDGSAQAALFSILAALRARPPQTEASEWAESENPAHKGSERDEVRSRGDAADVIRDESHPTLGSDRPKGARPDGESVGGCAEGDPRGLVSRPPETEASEALTRIAEYEDGWDGYGAPAFTDEQIDLALKVVAATRATDVCPYAGGIAVEVTRDLTIYVEDPDPTHGGPEAVARTTPPAPSSSPSTEGRLRGALESVRTTLDLLRSNTDRHTVGVLTDTCEYIDSALSTTHEEPEDG